MCLWRLLVALAQNDISFEQWRHFAFILDHDEASSGTSKCEMMVDRFPGVLADVDVEVAMINHNGAQV